MFGRKNRYDYEDEIYVVGVDDSEDEAETAEKPAVEPEQDIEIIDCDSSVVPPPEPPADTVVLPDGTVQKPFRSKYRARKITKKQLTLGALAVLLVTLFSLFCFGYRISYYQFADGTNATFMGRKKGGEVYVGTLYYNDGTTAKIDMRKNAVLFENGDYYIGSFVDCRQNGTGSLYYIFGDTYHGSFADGLADGTGTLYFVNGDVYTGEFKNGNMHGVGIYTWADGSTHKGAYQNGLRHGTGEYFDAAGILRYRGNYAEGAENGEGTYYFANGDVYTGSFHNGARTGYGKYTWANGEWYLGDFENGLPHGEGTYVWPNERTYTGTFYRGEPI